MLTPTKTILLYLISAGIFFAIDLVWLGTIAKSLYRRELGPILRDQFLAVPAVLFYSVFLAGMLYFVIVPAINANSLAQAMLGGAIFGFVTYATYDLTNAATLKHWSTLITVVDLAWGAFLSFSVSTIAYLLAQKIW